MKKNHKITIEYDGTSFFGWQKQKDQITIQGEIETALSRILNQDIAVSGSGRTDAGVHALGQVANFHADTKMLPGTLKKGFNSFIKRPIVIKDCHIVSPKFHARFSAVSKEYHETVYPNYWFAFHPHQKERIENSENAYVAFGCGSPETIVVIPFNKFNPLLDGMNQTFKENGKFYWHVQIFKETDRLILRRKKGLDNVDVTDYLI